MTHSKAFQAISSIAVKSGIIEAYHDDLTKHDYNALHGENPPQVFYWNINPCGTHMYTLESKPLQDVIHSVKTTYYRTGQRDFVWNGTELIEVSDKQASEVMQMILSAEQKLGNLKINS